MGRFGVLAAAAALSFAVGCDRSPLVLPADTGVIWTRITEARPGEPLHYQPDWRANTVLFTVVQLNRPTLATIDPDGAAPATIYPRHGRTADYYPRWLNDTLVIYSSDERVSGDFDIMIRSIGSDTLGPRPMTSFAGSELNPVPRPGTPGFAYIERTASGEFGRVALIADTAAAPVAPLYLTPDTLEVRGLDWDPSGQRLCYSVRSSDRTAQHIYVTSMSDTIPRQLTTGPFVEDFPRFSPDGTRILFISNRTGRWGVWAVDPAGEAAGLDVVAFEDRGAEIGNPAWSPDGLRIVLPSNGRSSSRSLYSLWVLSRLP